MKLRTLFVAILGAVLIVFLGTALWVNYGNAVSTLQNNWQREVDLTVSSLAGALARWSTAPGRTPEFVREAGSVISNEVVRSACLKMYLQDSEGALLYSWENSELGDQLQGLNAFLKEGRPTGRKPESMGLRPMRSAQEMKEAGLEGMAPVVPSLPDVSNQSNAPRPAAVVVDPSRYQQVEVYIKDPSNAPRGLFHLWISRSHLMDSLQRLRRFYFSIFFGSTLTILLLAWVLGAVIATPLERVASDMNRLTQGATGLVIEETGTTEIRELIQSFNFLSLEMEKKQRMEKELVAARQVQAALVPQKPPQFKSWQVYGISIPASEVGGDFFFHEVHQHLFCGVGDISGKGMPAALSVALSLGSLKTILGKDEPVEVMMRELNRTLSYQIKEGFLALNLLQIIAERPGVQLINAGQPYPLFYEARSRDIHFLGINESHLPLGVQPDVQYDVQEFQFEPEDTLILFSDGAVEMMNPRRSMIGFAGFQEIVHQSIASNLQEWSQGILARVMQHRKGYPQHDDVTLLMLRFSPS